MAFENNPLLALAIVAFVSLIGYLGFIYIVVLKKIVSYFLTVTGVSLIISCIFSIFAYKNHQWHSFDPLMITFLFSFIVFVGLSIGMTLALLYYKAFAEVRNKNLFRNKKQ
jgi:hypothetical protein